MAAAIFIPLPRKRGENNLSSSKFYNAHRGSSWLKLIRLTRDVSSTSAIFFPKHVRQIHWLTHSLNQVYILLYIVHYYYRDYLSIKKSSYANFELESLLDQILKKSFRKVFKKSSKGGKGKMKIPDNRLMGRSYFLQGIFIRWNNFCVDVNIKSFPS